MSDLCDQRMQNLIEGGLHQMNEFEEKIEQLEARIKSQEATIDALLAQNKTQMLEIEKHEAWQKESVKIFLSLVPTLEDQRCPHWHINQIKELIKQAEEN